MLLALTLIPTLATYLFRNGCKTWDNPVLRWLYNAYEHVLRVTVKRPAITVAFGAAVVIGAFVVAGGLGSEFLPQLDEGTIWVRANFAAGISLNKSAEEATHIRKILETFPEVQLVSSQSGRNDSGTDPYGPNRNEFFVALKPYDTWPAGMRKTDLVDQISGKLRAEIPGANFSLTQPIIDNVTEAVTGSPADLAVIISGSDLKRLRNLADQTLVILRRIPGAADTFLEQEAEQAQLRIQIDRKNVARYGINVRDVEDVIEMAIGGKAISTVFEGEKRFDVAVRFQEQARADADAIGNILVPTHDGGRVPLSQLASIQVVNGASIIARRENIRQISVRTNIRGRDQGSFVKEAQAKFEKGVQLPGGYSVDWGGQFENLERARKRLTIILPITIGIIFALLFFAFGDALHAGMVLVNVPFSLVGGILFLYLRGINLSVSAAVGFISLFGVAVMSGVLYISEINRRRAEPGTSLEDAVILGAKAQLRPTLMLILVAMLGMVPAARATGIGSDIQRPLATVVVGGLLSTLLLTLLVLPSLYCLVSKKGDSH
jgi:cobalt-zinc-cadmium resistance protein CzcA